MLPGSDLRAGVFDVRWELRRWLAAHDLPTGRLRVPHLPVVDAWALLDGGVLSVAGTLRRGAAG